MSLARNPLALFRSARAQPQRTALAAPPSRAVWKGRLKLALMSAPIQLMPMASESQRLHATLVSPATGSPIRMVKVDSVTGKPVDESVRAYEIAPNTRVTFGAADEAAIQLSSAHTIEIEEIVDRGQIDRCYVEKPYYALPDGDRRAFALIREAIPGSRMMALGRVLIGNCERVIALEPHRKGLVGFTLRYPHELRDPNGDIDAIPDEPLSDNALRLARRIAATKRASFDPSRFEDRYGAAVLTRLKHKADGRAVLISDEDGDQPPADLMQALRQSLAHAPPRRTFRRWRIASVRDAVLRSDAETA